MTRVSEENKLSADIIADILTKSIVILHREDFDNLDIHDELYSGCEVEIQGIYEKHLITRFTTLDIIDKIIVDVRSDTTITFETCYVDSVHVYGGVFGKQCNVNFSSLKYTVVQT